MVKVKVFVERENKTYDLDINGKKIIDILNHFGFSPSRFVVLKNKEIVTEDEEINENDYIEILDAVSGG